MARVVTLSEVKDGTASLADLMKMNALLDYQAALDFAAREKA